MRGVALGIVAIFVLALIFALPIMITWNAFIPNVCGFEQLTFWQAFYLALLGRFVCGSWSSGSSADE